MTDSLHRRFVFVAGDGHQIHAQHWRPASDPRAVIQIFHGLGEHSDRYSSFAVAANERGFVVVAHDHRGHGDNADVQGHYADESGWEKLLGDGRLVHQDVRETYPGIPVILLGHSMGSYVAQAYAMLYGSMLSALIVSASTSTSRARLLAAYTIAKVEYWRLGKSGRSALLDKLGFGNFNNRFRPARTELDWLSRDEREVDLYIADALCGGPYTCGLWLDLLGGLFGISSDKAIAQIPSELPILITGGHDDPVGGERGMTALAMRYARTGHQQLSVKIYPGGRHEMLHESNRDDVASDWLDWIESTV